MGYGLIVSRKSILGGMKPDDLEDFEADFRREPERGGPLSQVADRVAVVLRAHKDFEVRTAEVGQILLSRPSFLTGGCLIIKTPDRSIRVEMTVISTRSPFLLETDARLAGILFEAVGSRLYDARTGIPFITRPKIPVTQEPTELGG